MTCQPAAFAQPEGEAYQGVGGSPGLLRGLLALVARLGRLGGDLVGLRARGPCLGQLGLGLLGERARLLGGPGQFGEPPGGTAGTPGGQPGGQLPVLAEPRGEAADVVVPLGRPRAQRLPFLVGGVFVVHGRVRGHEEDVCALRVGRRGRRQQGGGRTDGHGRTGQQRGFTERLPRACVRGGVGDDHAVDQFGPRGEHARVVGGVDGLREVAPAGQGGDAVLAEELDRGQHVRAGRQQSPVTERAEDAGVVGGRRPQLEELPFGG